jgi:signal peptidase
MRPAMPPGALVVVTPTAPESIKIGDVITFQLSSGRPTVATHRVVAKGIGGHDEVRFLTKGDANGIPDQQWVRPVQLRGKVSYSIAYLGYPAQILTGRHRQLLVYLAAAGLIGYAAFMFGSAVRDRVRKPSGPSERMST